MVYDDVLLDLDEDLDDELFEDLEDDFTVGVVTLE